MKLYYVYGIPIMYNILELIDSLGHSDPRGPPANVLRRSVAFENCTASIGTYILNNAFSNNTINMILNIFVQLVRLRKFIL